MNILNENKTVISHLSVRAENTDALSLKLRFERLFGTGNFLPAGLPKEAIICIKHLRDPVPRSLNLYLRDSRFADAWEKAVARQIENLFRKAFRPIKGSVPAQAESIIFVNKAELLACLANDWCEGFLFQNWWWQGLFPNLEKAQTIARIWIESSEFIPTALQILFKKGAVTEFVKKLQPQETTELLAKIVETFGLKKLQTALFEPLTIKERLTFKEIAEKRKEDLPEKFSTEDFKSSEIFIEFAAEIQNQELTFEKEVFLGIGLMLDRAQRVVRSEKFALQIRKLKVESEFFSTKTYEKTEPISLISIKKKIFQPEIDKKTKFIQTEKAQTEFSEANAETDVAQTEKKKIVFHETEKTEKQPKKSLTKIRDYKEKKRSVKSERKAKGIDFEKSKPEISSQKKETKSKTKSAQSEDKKTISELLETSFKTDETGAFETIVHTNFGGIFYLLNLGLFLKLYCDFSEPSGEEIDLNIWDFVALLSRKFLGKKIESDEVWNLLKQLAEREVDKNFGEDFYPPDEWRIQTDWLKTFQTKQDWFWVKNESRLIVRHSENFNVIDVPLKKNFKKQLEKELETYVQYISEIVEGEINVQNENLQPQERFLNNLFEFAEMRLLQALNLETRDELNKVLFEKSATVAVSATNLDVQFRLNDLPLAVRFSGLDRNPGWIPAAGKYVKFHFV